MQPFNIKVRPDGSIQIGGATETKTDPQLAAYHCWLAAGYDGTVHDFLESLKAENTIIHGADAALNIIVDRVEHSKDGLILSVPAQLIVVDDTTLIASDVLDRLKEKAGGI